MFLHLLTLLILALSTFTLTLASSQPFTLLVSSSTNTTLNGQHAYIYIDPQNPYSGLLLLTSDPTIPATAFTLDTSVGHLLAHLPFSNSSSSSPPPTLSSLEASTSNDAYDETLLFYPPATVSTAGLNPPTCHEYQDLLSCSVTSEGGVRLSSLYVCPGGVGYGTREGALKIGREVVEGCWAVGLGMGII